MELNALQATFRQPGKVIFIGIRPARLEPVVGISETLAIENQGLQGDRYKNEGGSRQVTLIQEEHVRAVASFLGQGEIDPRLMRSKRNKPAGTKRETF